MNNDDFINKLNNSVPKQINNDYGNKSIDSDIEYNIKSYLTYGNISKWVIIVATIIISLICFTNEETIIIGILILPIGLIIAFLISVMIKWFGYSLKCLYDIRNNTNNNKINNKE